MHGWYVVNTHAKAEYKAAWHLENQGFGVYLPQYTKQRRHARRVDTVRAPLFPRYLFVELDLDEAPWRAVMSTVGVSHLICGGGRPLALPDGIIVGIRAREDENGLVPIAREARYRKGDTLRITDGALVDRIGLFDGQSDQDRVTMLLDLLGRQVRVQVPLEAVAAHG